MGLGRAEREASKGLKAQGGVEEDGRRRIGEGWNKRQTIAVEIPTSNIIYSYTQEDFGPL
jgi:hypothetical protein